MTPNRLADLEKFRAYLRLLARMHLDVRLQGKLDPSDVVQDVLVKAVAAFDQYRGVTEAELAGWLRQILARHLANLLRDLVREKRDIGREQALMAAIDQSSVRLEGWLAAEQTSPSMRAECNEQLLQLAEAIDRLHSTAHSHHRIVLVKAMGHNVGLLTLRAGIAGGADVTLIPEFP